MPETTATRALDLASRVAGESLGLTERVRERAMREPSRLAFTFLADGEGDERHLTYGDLDRRAKGIAARLQGLGLAGERALLLFPPGLDYAAAFLGCLYAGTVAVPAYPPTGSRGLPRLAAIVGDCEPRLVLSVSRFAATVATLAGASPGGRLPLLLADEVDEQARGADSWRDPGLRPDDLAFLQYTSGSTSTPKGVEVSHGNLLANERMIEETFCTGEESVVVSWLPLYHDMGLIGGLLHPLYLGARCILLSPLHFLQRPARWLEAISRHGADTSGGPNFAYELCARRVSPGEAAALDLSRWRVAFNGAEPVRAAALDHFAAAFAASGFQRAAFFPCYGLAEATLVVSGGRRGREVTVLAADAEALAHGRVEDKGEAAATGEGESGVRRLVSCGRVPSGLDVRIVDPATGAEVPPSAEGEQVGEVWIAGASVARGYWRRPEASAEAFGARLAGSPEPYLRTGDLGFLRAGELYVTGRSKDLVIVRGRNLYPQDVEWTAERSHPALRPGCGAAFAIEQDGEERLALVQEVEGKAGADLAPALAAIREAVATEHEVQVSALALVKPGTVPKTTSGKVQRRACRELYLQGALAPLAAWTEGADAPGSAAGSARIAPRTPAEERVAAIWEEVLALPAGTVGAEDSFFALGGDSLRGSQLLARLAESAGLEVALEELFDEPTVAALALRLSGSAAQPARDERGGERIPAADRSQPLPLTSQQRRLWFLDQLQPGNPAYNLGFSVRLTGALDAGALAAAWAALGRRHESLRTAFQVLAGAPVQGVQALSLALPVVDLSALPAPWRQAVALERESARRPFDLAHAPLARAILVRLGDGPRGMEHELQVVLHHIVSDAWSIGVVLRDLLALYAAQGSRQAPALAPLPVQYGDYAVWQEGRLAAEALEAKLAVWRRRLAGSLPVLDLPADRPRPPVQSLSGAHARRFLPAGLAAALRGLATARGASLFMALLAGFQALLHRATGQDDVLVGTAAANRDRVELEGLVGFFVNTLPLRTDLAGDPPFAGLLGRARETVLEAFRGREVPFERLVDELQPERDLSRTPIVQVLLVLQNAPLAVAAPPGLALAPREVDNGTARFDLALSLVPTEHGIEAVFKYSRDLFDAATLERLGGHLERLLEAAVADPGRRLSELPLLGEAERHQVVLEWNATDVAGLERSTLHEIFEAQVDRALEATALVYEGQILTYGEMDRRANRLARRLRRLGVGPEVLVGVAAERSLDLMVALYAVLKAGGAYVPLDPAYPADRLAFMMEDARIPVLLTQERLLAQLPRGEHSDTRVLCLDSDWQEVAAESDQRLHVPVLGEHPAYAIYTSGSTGRPKGALIPHRGIVNRLRWMQAEYGLEPGEGVLQKTPVSFDVSVWELFWPLLVGARLVLARPGGHQDSAYLAGRIAEEAVTTLHFVPSMLQVFLEEPRLATCASLRRVIASGEALPLELSQRFAERLGRPLQAELHNLYGPTEAAVDVSSWACGREEGRAGVPIGRPISNLRLHLLDREGRPVPVGIPGHLHIGGVGLARGYLHRPDLTAERFVPDPLAHLNGPGERLYATGDLARLRPDGAIDFLGRLDHQVKIRGFRIELGEIEAALNAHPVVRESVVVALAARSGPRLVAYLVSHGEPPNSEELAVFLAARLPEHMVPANFVALPAFPLTPSGKVDRKALPQPSEEPRSEEAGWVAPRTALEERLAVMWGEQLGVARVGAHDNFFALGGDSIQAALLVNRLQRELGTIVYVMALFDAPTPAKLAAHLAAGYREALVKAGWLAGGDASAEEAAEQVRDEAADLAALEAFVATRFSPPWTGGEPEPAVCNRPAVFLLSPFRSGSTLLRVMLAGHPGLFAPPELELLGFRSLGERRRAFAGRDSFSREGLLRAVMELCNEGPEEAAARVAAAEAADAPTPVFYGRLQEWAGGRLLVDKTPRYALDLATLRRAERWFAEPRYVHLVRHPAATSSSYLEAKMDQVYRFPLPPRRQAELVWRRSHENVLAHLAEVPEARWHRLRFEDLVREPRAAMEALCGFLGLDFDPAMVAPYEGKRMTDGLHGAGRMMGDPKFHTHRRIEAGVAERWRHEGEARGFTAPTWNLAERLGYERPADHEPPSREAIAPRSRTEQGELPLSFGQQRIWFLDRLEPGGSAYNMPAAVRLLGPLDVPALARAGAEVERRHEVLRTVFPAAGGRPRQVLRQALQTLRRALLPVVDLAALPAPRRESEAARQTDEEAHRPFDLAAGPLWRLALLRLGPDQHRLLVNLHHVVSDGWSVGVLTRELAALYAAFCAGAASPLAELPLQYADFAAWQRRHLAGERLAGLLAYWRERLSPPPAPLELPVDRPRPLIQRHRGARLPLALPAGLAGRLRELARAPVEGTEAGTTLFMVLVAAVQGLLGRWSGQDDVALGTPVAGRNRAEVEGLAGVFVNTLVLRTDLSGDPGFRALLGRAREVCLGAVRHEELPFERLVEELAVDRSLGQSPLFSVMLAFQNAPAGDLALPGLTVERLEVATRTAKLDLTIDLAERQGSLAGAIEYDSDLFDPATVRRLAGHLANLLEGAVAAPEARLADLPLLSVGERHELVVEAGDTVEPFPAGASIHDLFAAAARRAPAAPAVAVEGGEPVSYGDLAAWAERLARTLTGLGVGPEVRVGICAERSPALVAAVLGVLAAGGAYVPLDPTLPRERLAFVLADSGVPVLLAERALLAALPEHGARVVLLDEPDGDAAAPPALPEAPPPPSDIAYVIYTSGSTGRPKGVAVRQQSVVSYLSTLARRIGLGGGDVMMAVTTLSFDIAVTELLLPLVLGGRVELVRRETVGDAARLAAAIDRAGATAMQATPATFSLLLDGGWPGRPGLKVLCGGEALPRALAARLLPRVGELWNVYGPTESTVWSTAERIVATDRIAIGRPLGNESVLLLGRHGELVPRGVVGELAIGGLGLARGYHGRPELTAERFVPASSGGPGARLYLTGDLARHLPDGTLECLGRVDHQVKVRGFRIELGEIEAVLSEHPAVSQCAVVALGSGAAERRLVGYVILAAGAAATLDGLRSFLKERLPLPMVPSALVFLPRLPLLPSGKVDRKSLPDPGHERPDLAASFVPPQNERERLIALVWQQVLGLDRVGVHDNFFDLGGHSMLAAEVHGKLRERLGIDFPLLDLFQHSTVHALAARLGTGEAAGRDLGAVQDTARREGETVRRRRQALAHQRAHQRAHQPADPQADPGGNRP